MSSTRSILAAGFAAAAFLAPVQSVRADTPASEVRGNDQSLPVGSALPAAPATEAAVPSADLAVPSADPVTSSAEAGDDEVLASQRGGDQRSTTSTINTDGIVTDNAAYNLVTGNNTIRDGSFANMNGMPLVIQNTGNNVLIQNSTILNLEMR